MESEGSIQLNTKKNKKSHSKKASKHKKRKLSTRNVKKYYNNGDSSSDAFLSDTELESSNAVCACCYEWNEELYECYLCNRKYHEDCHIPEITHRIENETEWQCTLCEDITAISKDLGKDHDVNNISIGTVGRKIVERMLMELFCQFAEIDYFRNSTNKAFFRENLKHKTEENGLNDIRNLLRKNNYYTSLDVFLEDTKQVFVNALSCYSVGHPHFRLATKLLKFLNIMYNKWIMSTLKKSWKNRKQMAG
ncbi:nuclear body protein SP140-like protein [Rhopalosiphum maidis]|uniref:nuclear body protein SP140-like protein n=1 Tax=Rhopalosiphum maidis TaxID=43146 RepID=UPI000EFE2A4C|nr:nuclear body protein SP140-like protein [Rhopalosiphum maidis]